MNELVQDWTAPHKGKLTIRDFVRLDESGAFDAYAKTELVDGEVLAGGSQFRPHAFIKSELAFRLRDAVAPTGLGLFPVVEVGVGIPPHNVLEPDIVLTSEARGDGFVPLGSVAIVVEVAATSPAFDLGRKRDVYAAAAIPEYWIADVEARVIHQFWSPAGSDYAQHREIPFGQRIGSATIPDLSVETDGLG